jgi:drug/metabolite transporter (DMT)-like permease
MPPLGVTAFRVSGAAAILIFIYRFSRYRQGFRPLRKQDYLFFFKLAVTGLLLNQTLFVLGLSYSTVAHSALIVILRSSLYLDLRLAKRRRKSYFQESPRHAFIDFGHRFLELQT